MELPTGPMGGESVHLVLHKREAMNDIFNLRELDPTIRIC